MNYWDVINSERERRREREEKEREGAEGREKERDRGIIIQLSVLRRAELTRTEADFLLLTHPSATSPCRKREREKERGGVGWIEKETHTRAHMPNKSHKITHTQDNTDVYMLLLYHFWCTCCPWFWKFRCENLVRWIEWQILNEKFCCKGWKRHSDH